MILLRPNHELVTIAWLRTVIGDRVSTTLPKDNTTWAASGFCTISVVGGSPNAYVPMREPVMSVDCWAVNPNSQKPPWDKASMLAEAIQAACWDHPRIPQTVTLPAGYPAAQIKSAYCTGDPRRVPDDPSSYARYSIPGLALAWIAVPS